MMNQNNTISLTVATQQLNTYFNSLSSFWRWFFPAPLANALIRNEPPEKIVQAALSSTWFLHTLIFPHLNVFSSTTQKIHSTESQKDIDFANNRIITLASPLTTVIKDDAKMSSTKTQEATNTSNKGAVPLAPLFATAIEDEAKRNFHEVILAIPTSPQSLKNEFINIAQNHNRITPQITTYVKGIVEKYKLSNKDDFKPHDKCRALDQLIAAKMINSDELPNRLEGNSEQEKSDSDDREVSAINESYFSMITSSSYFLFPPQQSMTEALIKALVLHDTPIKLAKLLIGMHERNTLTLATIEASAQITAESPMSFEQLDALLNSLFNECQRSSNEQATADFNGLCQCQTSEELNAFIDALDTLPKEKKEGLAKLLPEESFHLANLFGSPS